MKNNFLILIFFSFFLFSNSFGENLNIEASSITIDKKSKTSIFKENVVAKDLKNNTVKTDYAEYQKDSQTFESKGRTTILTSEGFFLEGENIFFDNSKDLITSKSSAIITDLENNKIFLDNFEYSTKNNFFRSVGNIKITDIKDNSYNFTQLYLDEKKREIIGTDVKAYLNDENFKTNKKNKPRIFANTVSIKDKKSKFNKSVFTLCDYRNNDKCPPWLFQANEMSHDQEKKTVYYENAVIKFYDVPIFYFPKLSHPDPSVKRRSGFLPPSFTNSKNLGSGFELPYFFALGYDKDITFSAKIFDTVHPLYLAEYRKAYKDSNLIVDTGYTQGYKSSTLTKKTGDKSHFFSKFVKNFVTKDNSNNNLVVTVQDTSNDKYLKLYKIDTDLVNHETDFLENSINYTRDNEDSFLGLQISSFETLKDTYNDKYEYILPNIVYDRNLISSKKFGNIDLKSNIAVRNYETNKFTKFFTNDFDWKIKSLNFSSGLKGEILGKLRNVNYEAKNTNEYKKDPTSEFFGALGYLASIDLFKNPTKNSEHILKPKMLIRYAPGHMRKHIEDDTRLNSLNLFDLHRIDGNHNFENGLSTTLGFDYEINNINDEQFKLSLGQVINNKENKHMPSTSSLDEKLSDVVGMTSFEVKSNSKLNYKLDYQFKIDQNYQELNYNELGSTFDFEPFKVEVNYLQEKKHIGTSDFIKTNFTFKKGDSGLLSFKNKRNLIKHSSEYYDLSYEYLNDCLRAGIVYRREFYNDSELEPENSLMFKITLTPFANINTPLLN